MTYGHTGPLSRSLPLPIAAQPQLLIGSTAYPKPYTLEIVSPSMYRFLPLLTSVTRLLAAAALILSSDCLAPSAMSY